MGPLSLIFFEHHSTDREENHPLTDSPSTHACSITHATHRLTAALTSIRSVNKTDAMTLSSNLGPLSSFGSGGCVAIYNIDKTCHMTLSSNLGPSSLLALCHGVFTGRLRLVSVV